MIKALRTNTRSILAAYIRIHPPTAPVLPPTHYLSVSFSTADIAVQHMQAAASQAEKEKATAKAKAAAAAAKKE